MTAEEFIALPDAEKNRIVAEIEAETPDQRLAGSTPLTPELRRRWNKFKKNVKANRRGRPQMGAHGVKVVSLSLEKELLRRADAYAKRNDMKRSELVTRGIQAIIGNQS
jgi:hypothetical protein